ncbi:PPOX class probable F420-dependent enzyme [Actinokineospora alba]|uniref:PPOX class probable F420-dependent enzyme n=1 Tax=Actinokineospora alba TaxID=504798 RepID=A0A1H0PVW7_9PSEU|nr:pyridoxamine 5'-phosphate oxidase family protein [Actinokineospora alba]TDP65949.1 PPOX class probable F420-dependent enzyme [Actinokineospora alba]SDI61501.1 PPOX class probable F420-dependent enzyme [Actinokineospora alba]SDP08686.1 PPOX class probable F420-dependent enzyme [Actinokineospora alba]
MSRRDQIKLSPEEIQAFLGNQKTANVATIGKNGRPHLVSLWYLPEGDILTTWTYESSQKVANLRRLPQATVLVESGESYEELVGVMLECDVELVEDTERITQIGSALTLRYTGSEEVAAAASQFVRAQAAKRIGLVFKPTKIVSWDHSKLGGTY